MSYKRLLIWVEGSKDKRFFDSQIKPLFMGYYDWVEVRTWAEMKKKKICAFVNNMCKINMDYIFVADIHGSPCVTQRKEKITKKMKNIEEEQIIIVKTEIESWYLAGLTKEECKKLKITHFNNTENVTKGQFNDLIPSQFTHEVPFMIEILENSYCIDTAKQQNASFNYLVNKFNLNRID